jgi:hypothetical protein
MSADYYLYGGYSKRKIAKIQGGAPDCPTAVLGSILPSSQAGCDQGTVCILQVTGGLASAWPPVEEYPGKKLVRTTSSNRKFAYTVYTRIYVYYTNTGYWKYWKCAQDL